MAETTEEPSLNPYQRRALEVTLRMLEETLDRVELLLRATPLRGVFYEMANPYTPEEERALRQRIAEVRSVLREIHEAWHLGVERTSLDVFIRSAMSVLWADLEDCRPKKLRRYGDVNPLAASQIEATIERLIRLTEDFGRRV